MTLHVVRRTKLKSSRVPSIYPQILNLVLSTLSSVFSLNANEVYGRIVLQEYEGVRHVVVLN